MEEEIHPNSCYQARITQIQTPDKDLTRRKIQANILNEHRYKNLQQESGTTKDGKIGCS